MCDFPLSEYPLRVTTEKKKMRERNLRGSVCVSQPPLNAFLPMCAEVPPNLCICTGHSSHLKSSSFSDSQLGS